MDSAALRTELLNDPLNLGYAPFMAVANDWALADLLNAKAYRGPVPLRVLSAYCVGIGVIGGCEAVADDTSNPVRVRGLCRTVVTLIRDDYRLETADVDDPAFGAAADGLVGLGLMTIEQKAGMLGLAESRASRAEKVLGYGTVVTPSDVGACR